MTQVVEITGHWEYRGVTKSSPIVFVVTEVDGEPLIDAAEFNRYIFSLDGNEMNDKEVTLGQNWTRKAIEVGGFRNTL